MARPSQLDRSSARLSRINDDEPLDVSAASRMPTSPAHRSVRACCVLVVTVGGPTHDRDGQLPEGRQATGAPGSTERGPGPGGTAVSPFTAGRAAGPSSSRRGTPSPCNSRRIWRAFPHPSASRRRIKPSKRSRPLAGRPGLPVRAGVRPDVVLDRLEVHPEGSADGPKGGRPPGASAAPARTGSGDPPISDCGPPRGSLPRLCAVATGPSPGARHGGRRARSPDRSRASLQDPLGGFAGVLHRCQRSATCTASGAASPAAWAYAVARSRETTSTPGRARSQAATVAASRSGSRSITRRRSRSTRMVPYREPLRKAKSSTPGRGAWDRPGGAATHPPQERVGADRHRQAGREP